MARKSRRQSSKKSSSSPLVKFFILAALIVVSSVFLGYQKPQVLGIMDHINTTPTPTPAGGPTPTPGSTCKPPRVNILRLSNPCDPSTRDGFRKAEYKCSNDKTGTIEKGCMNVSEALSYAKYVCGRNSCKPTPTVTITPTPHEPTPTREPSPTPTPHL